MGRNPDTKHHDIDDCNNGCGGVLDIATRLLVLGDDGYPIHDDLHNQLNLENPEEENHKKNGKSVLNLAKELARDI
jgi:hypothetical protein